MHEIILTFDVPKHDSMFNSFSIHNFMQKQDKIVLNNVNQIEVKYYL